MRTEKRYRKLLIMERTLITIETPVGKNKVEMKPWITGAESEYINAPLMESFTVTPNVEGKTADMSKIDMSKISVMNHRMIEKFVVSVDGKTDKVLDAVLSLHEDDTEFIYAKIAELRKKK